MKAVTNQGMNPSTLSWDNGSAGEPDAISVFTLVLWSICLLVGVLGFILHYQRPHAPIRDQPILAQQLEVELAQDLPPPAAVPPDPLTPPPPPDELNQPQVVQPIAVAQPSPAVAFALPIEGPTRVVDARRAEYVRPAQVTNQVVQRLVFGEAEGKQPAPDYPRTARRLRQEGIVVVRFTVGTDGRVVAAEAAQRSPWPLLDEAALTTVKERWRFKGGPIRVYEVSIRFEMEKN
jgi:TonB family protein